VLDDPVLAKSLGAQGAQRAHEFAWDTVTDRLVKVYREVVNQRVEGRGSRVEGSE
jgi:glycosyltransferase involved in cell wall biosynthesis